MFDEVKEVMKVHWNSADNGEYNYLISYSCTYQYKIAVRIGHACWPLG